MGPWNIGVRPQCGSYYDDKAKNALNKAMQDEDIEWKFEANYISSREFWDWTITILAMLDLEYKCRKEVNKNAENPRKQKSP